MKHYKKHLLYKLDKDGKLILFYGAEGKATSFEDTVLLNFRKKETWD